MPLVTRNEVKAIEGIGPSDSSYDTRIDNLLAPVTDFIEGATGKIYAQRTGVLEYHSGNGSPMVSLKSRPIQSVTNLWDDTSRAYGDDTKIDPANYFVDLAIGVITLDTAANSDLAWLRDHHCENVGFSRGNGNIKVELVAGYAPGSEPQRVKELASALIMLKINEQGGNAGIQSETLEGYSYTMADVKSIGAWATTTLELETARGAAR